ncbi:MAG: hypothetical protein JRE28_01080 [Deltaproteobacteria bacterium]|nr:hypothetical protein [Deltaproteobacteria bacterium]
MLRLTSANKTVGEIEKTGILAVAYRRKILKVIVLQKETRSQRLKAYIMSYTRPVFFPGNLQPGD